MGVRVLVLALRRVLLATSQYTTGLRLRSHKAVKLAAQTRQSTGIRNAALSRRLHRQAFAYANQSCERSVCSATRSSVPQRCRELKKKVEKNKNSADLEWCVRAERIDISVVAKRLNLIFFTAESACT